MSLSEKRAAHSMMLILTNTKAMPLRRRNQAREAVTLASAEREPASRA
jgi:hypothetical protein